MKKIWLTNSEKHRILVDLDEIESFIHKSNGNLTESPSTLLNMKDGSSILVWETQEEIEAFK